MKKIFIILFCFIASSCKHHHMREPIWENKAKTFVSKKDMYKSYFEDKQICDNELRESFSGVYDPDFAKKSLGKCLEKKGWSRMKCGR